MEVSLKAYAQTTLLITAPRRLPYPFHWKRAKRRNRTLNPNQHRLETRFEVGVSMPPESRMVQEVRFLLRLVLGRLAVGSIVVLPLWWRGEMSS